MRARGRQNHAREDSQARHHAGRRTLGLGTRGRLDQRHAGILPGIAPCTPRTCRTCRVLLGSECMRREGAGDAPNMHVHTALRMYLAVSTLIIGAVIGNAWTRWRHGQRL